MAVCGSVREGAGSKPPMVVFSACLVVFALTLVGVSLYLQSNRSHLTNPDVTVSLDWNSFYGRLSGLEMCFQPENSSEVTTQASPAWETTTPQPNSTEGAAVVRVSVAADVDVVQGGVSLRGTTLHTLVPAKALGHSRDQSVLELTVALAPRDALNWTACLLLVGPPHLLPDASIRPPNCTLHQEVEAEEVEVSEPSLGMGWQEWCSTGVLGHMVVAPQQQLNVYLSQGDVTLIQLHILYMTCMLFVTMLLLLCYYMRGRMCVVVSSRTVVHTPDKIPLNP